MNNPALVELNIKRFDAMLAIDQILADLNRNVGPARFELSCNRINGEYQSTIKVVFD
jgi:hypothetical protein